MRQFLFLLCFFSCFSVLADHDGSSGYNYNDRTFRCTNYNKAKDLAENAKNLVETRKAEASLHYNWALCQIHRGPEQLMAGIVTLKQAADMGSHRAAITLAGYFTSDGYDLPRGEVTDNESNFQKAVEYEELTIDIIRSQPNYPFSDPYHDDLIAERRSHLYLKTASNLTASYSGQFADRISTHIESTNKNIGNTTVEPLRKTIEAANNCLAISYNEDVWSRNVYDKYMARCEESKRIAQLLLPLEQKRLRVAYTSCQNIKLSKCEAHNQVESKIYQLYVEHLSKADQLLASL